MSKKRKFTQIIETKDGTIKAITEDGEIWEENYFGTSVKHWRITDKIK